MATEAMAPGWSSLPADHVDRIADCVLADNDLDYYMALRAVCHGWRSSTADPKTSHGDARFRPTRWVVLDEESDSDTRFFVNATTGRFVRRRLPLLRDADDYHFVSSTTGGFLVLADREPPHAALVINPFTGSMIRFKAPTPSDVYFAADVVGVAPTLVLVVGTSPVSDEFRFFLADPDSERFDVGQDTPALLSHDDAETEFDLDSVASALLVLRGLAVKLADCPGEMLRVDRSLQQGIRLFRMDSKGRAMEQVTSIGSYALFLGANRAMSFHADSGFPSVKANSIYYNKEEEDGSTHTYMYDLALDEEEIVSETNNAYYIYPASIIQLLVQFTECTTRYEPGWDQLVGKFAATVRSTMSKETWEEMMFDMQMGPED